MTFDYPPRLAEDNEAYVRQLQSFLFQLCEKLNIAMDAIDSGTFSDTSSARKGAPVIMPGGGGITPETKQAYEELKALIKNTAEHSRHEIATLGTALGQTNANVSAVEGRTTELESGLADTDADVDALGTALGSVATRTGTLETGITTVQAEIDEANETAAEHWNSFLAYGQRTDSNYEQLVSGVAEREEYVSAQFGSYDQQFTNLNTATAQLNNQLLTFDSLLVAQDERMSGFDTYRMTTEGFIRQGFISQGAGEPPIIGIAIGQNATTSVTRTIDGVTYYEANTEDALAFYTAQKVSFYLHGIEVAYISNENLYINSANIINDVTVGDFRFISSPTGGLTIKWVGA